MTRYMASLQIAELLTAAGYQATAWARGSTVRIYLDRRLGYLAITAEGRIEPHLHRQRGSIMKHVPDLQIEAAAALAAEPARQECPDDPLDRLGFEASRNIIDPLERG